MGNFSAISAHNQCAANDWYRKALTSLNRTSRLARRHPARLSCRHCKVSWLMDHRSRTQESKSKEGRQSMRMRKRMQQGQVVRIADRWFVRYWERRNVGGTIERKR